MPRRMPPLATELAADITRALALARLGEVLRAGAVHGAPAMQLHPRRLEALYEMAFLRVFVAWEVFLEQTYYRYLCGYISAVSPHALRQAAIRNLAAAEVFVLGPHPYVSWAPRRTITRARSHIVGSAHEMVLNSSITRLEWFTTIRNRVAHKGKHSQQRRRRLREELAILRVGGGAAEDGHGLGGGRATRHEIEGARAERREGDVLARHRADTGPGIGTAGGDGGRGGRRRPRTCR